MLFGDDSFGTAEFGFIKRPPYDEEMDPENACEIEARLYTKHVKAIPRVLSVRWKDLETIIVNVEDENV